MKKKKYPSNPFTWPDFNWRMLTSNDWSLYFQNSIIRVKLKEFPSFVWAKITNSGLPNIEFRTEIDDKRIMRMGSDIEEFDFSLPPTGAYNFKNTVFFFFRRFSRQWIKGICKNSAAFVPILDYYKLGNKFAPLVEKSFSVPHSFFTSPKDVAELFNCRYYSLQEAYELLQKKSLVARALSNNLVISLGARSEQPILWLSSIPVGRVESAKPEISLFYPELGTELSRQIPQALFSFEEPEHHGDASEDLSAIEVDTTPF